MGGGVRTTTGRRQRTKGWRKEPGDVCVDPTSRWGNGWRIIADDSGERVGFWVCCDNNPHAQLFEDRDEAAVYAVNRYTADIRTGANEAARYIANHVHELRGHRLLCFCAIDAPCHRNALAVMADA